MSEKHQPVFLLLLLLLLLIIIIIIIIIISVYRFDSLLFFPFIFILFFCGDFDFVPSYCTVETSYNMVFGIIGLLIMSIFGDGSLM